MNRNQKIALGCGGTGCIGLIVIVIVVAVLIGTGYIAAPGITSYTNTNSNSNRNSNYNASYNRNSNTNTVSNSNSSSSSTMSFDAKHRLYQAAGTSKDTGMMLRVIRKIGLGDGTGSDHQDFVKEHFVWAKDNFPFIRSINTPEKARAYVEEHIND